MNKFFTILLAFFPLCLSSQERFIKLRSSLSINTTYVYCQSSPCRISGGTSIINITTKDSIVMGADSQVAEQEQTSNKSIK